MRALHQIALVAIIGISGCATPEKPRDLTEVIPGYTPVPQDVIADLPRRIQRLPEKRSMSGSDFLSALGLSKYSANITGSVRFNSHYLELDEEHTLQMRCDPDSLVIRSEDIDHILNSTAPPPGGSRLNGTGCEVVGCTLRRNWTHVIAHRQLANQRTEQGADDQLPARPESKAE